MPRKFLKDLPVIFLNNSSFTNCSARSSTSLFSVQPGTVCLPSTGFHAHSVFVTFSVYHKRYPQKDFNASLTYGFRILAPCVVQCCCLSAECPILLLTSL